MGMEDEFEEVYKDAGITLTISSVVPAERLT